MNSLRPGEIIYMRQWTGLLEIQVMAFCLFNTKLSVEPVLTYCQFDTNFYQNGKIFFTGNASLYIVCKIVAVLFTDLDMFISLSRFCVKMPF